MSFLKINVSSTAKQLNINMIRSPLEAKVIY